MHAAVAGGSGRPSRSRGRKPLPLLRSAPRGSEKRLTPPLAPSPLHLCYWLEEHPMRPVTNDAGH
jgi:hypothetical protein